MEEAISPNNKREDIQTWKKNWLLWFLIHFVQLLLESQYQFCNTMFCQNILILESYFDNNEEKLLGV